ncbi:protein O-mannosyl-transferase family [Spongiimicrobium sp. 3-5]|uniref:protein O-mannosyl-transferase family n=1 Tax=Spongiimicrobium sp. 3-5 TaxID=3332596 RepID=UPI0039813814
MQDITRLKELFSNPSREFKFWDKWLGWFVFSISLIVYTLTIEPTVSFWDAGELIAASAKLEVAHPPGAPLLQMIGAFLAMFAIETTQIAFMVNYVSTLSSAFAILFTFWTVTNLTKKLIPKEKTFTNSKAIAVLGSGLVGALTLAFTDSFWFNAVETEVYAMASLVMALLLWLGLKWTDNLDDPRNNKWPILISFVVGLTFGIQFMGFLAIPAVVLLYYFKKFKTITLKNFIFANLAAVAILMLVFKFSLTYILKFFGWGEVFFVNSFGLPFNSGTGIVGLFLVSVFYFALSYTRKKRLYKTNTIVLSIMFLCLGFSTWIVLPLRANAHVAINENDPSDARALLAYFNREQYPSTDSPFYGTYYSDRFAASGEDRDDHPKYERNKDIGKYEIVNLYEDAIQGPNKKHIGVLPRMWSEMHAENYIKYFGALEFNIKSGYKSNKDLLNAVGEFKKGYADGEINEEQYVKFLEEFSEYIEVQPPSVWDNMDYMFQFQLGYMYWRYFMWNFVGRQNDVQGRYNGNGEWLSGIGFIDALRLGSQNNLPSEVLNNKGRNTYYFLPLLLGIVGIVFLISKNPKLFWVLFVFFMFTGVAIQFYTNPTIFQPRERDYSLVGSFYVFAIWIGLGTYALFDGFKKWVNPKILAPAVSCICLLAVTGLMACQNWDDHDRSHRYTARTSAKSYLDSTKQNSGAILFTIGDNDNFPLWYIQEIEEYRIDVRILVTSYFATDWYIDQAKRKSYESDPIPSQLTHNIYRYGTRDAIYYQGLPGIAEKRWNIKDFMNWIGSDKPQTKLKYVLEKQEADLSQFSESTLNLVYYPTHKIRIDVDKDVVLKNGLVREKDAAQIVDYIDIDLPRSAITKNRIMMLDVIANNNWERPIYFSGGSYDDAEYIWMKDYLQLDGIAYKLVPIETKYEGGLDMGRVDEDLGYRIVKKLDWGNLGSPNIYHDPQTRKQGGVTLRIALARLAEKLIAENKISKAKEIIEIAMAHIPVDYFGYYTFLEPYVDSYYKVGETIKARGLFQKLKKVYEERLNYYASTPLDEQYGKIENILSSMEAYRRNIDILVMNNDLEFAKEETLLFNQQIEKFHHFYSDRILE